MCFRAATNIATSAARRIASRVASNSSVSSGVASRIVSSLDSSMYSIVSTQRGENAVHTALRNQLVIDKRDCEKRCVCRVPTTMFL